MFEDDRRFELVGHGQGTDCAHGHIMIKCPGCHEDILGAIVDSWPYRGPLDLTCGCGFSLRVYVDTATGEVSSLRRLGTAAGV